MGGAATDAVPGPLVGEVSLLYTHPRTWERSTGRHLVNRATWSLLAAAYQEVVLWTEYRNERALAVYQANGWCCRYRSKVQTIEVDMPSFTLSLLACFGSAVAEIAGCFAFWAWLRLD